MKKVLFFIALAAIALTSCKTTEANYRAAYEMALQKDKEGIDDDTYTLIKQNEKPREFVFQGDTLRVITESVIITKNVGNDDAKLTRYKVAIGSFRQVFNAKAMKGRISDKGYNAFIVETAEPSYYVIASACDTQEQAKEVIACLQADKSIILRLPYPCILEPIKY